MTPRVVSPPHVSIADAIAAILEDAGGNKPHKTACLYAALDTIRRYVEIHPIAVSNGGEKCLEAEEALRRMLEPAFSKIIGFIKGSKDIPDALFLPIARLDALTYIEGMINALHGDCESWEAEQAVRLQEDCLTYCYQKDTREGNYKIPRLLFEPHCMDYLAGFAKGKGGYISERLGADPFYNAAPHAYHKAKPSKLLKATLRRPYIETAVSVESLHPPSRMQGFFHSVSVSLTRWQHRVQQGFAWLWQKGVAGFLAPKTASRPQLEVPDHDPQRPTL